MLIYVAHEYGGNPYFLRRAKKITHDLQLSDPANCYVCPLLVFSSLKYGEVSFEDEMNLFLDVLTVCDKMLVCSNISRGVQAEIDFAEMVGIPVEEIDP